MYRTSYPLSESDADWFWGNIEDYYVKALFKRVANSSNAKRKANREQQKFVAKM